MFRIHRDVRFSKDKHPYKEHGACQFRHRLGRDVHAPGFYVPLAPKEVFVGAGLWMPDSDALLKIRTALAEKPAAWKKIVADIRRKSFVVGRDSSESVARAASFVAETAECFASAAPFMRFLCSALSVPM